MNFLTIGAASRRAHGDGFAERVIETQPRFFYRMNAATGATTEVARTISPFANGTPAYTGTAGSGYTLQQTGFVNGGKSVAFGGSAALGRLITGASGQTFSFTAPQRPMSFMVAFNANASGHGAFPVIMGKVKYYAETSSDFPISLRWDAATSKVILRLDSGNDFSADFDLSSGTLSTGTDYLCIIVLRGTGTNGIEIWMNGALNATGTYAGSLAAATGTFWTVGGATPYYVTGDQSCFKGRCAEAAMWSVALTPAQIAFISNSRAY